MHANMYDRISIDAAGAPLRSVSHLVRMIGSGRAARLPEPLVEGAVLRMWCEVALKHEPHRVALDTE